MRQTFIGMVVGTKMTKTAKVRVPRLKTHRIMQKEILDYKVFFAHDKNELCKVGDVVRIEACRPLSKKKSFAIAEIIKKAEEYIEPETNKTLNI